MFVALALLTVSLGETDLSISRDTLRAAGYAPDGNGALAYLKTWIPDPDRQGRLRGYLRQLGDDEFEKREEASRELRKAGPSILADLKRVADSTDLEISRRAREILDHLQQHSPAETVVAACTLLRASRPGDTDAVVLKFAPFVPDRESEMALLEVADTLGATPAIRAALTDPEPLRRRLAVRGLGADQRDALRAALRDSDIRVRFEAGRGLVRLGDRAGIAVLVEALAKGDLPLAWRAEEFLWRIARESAPPVLLKTAAERQRCHEGWLAWYAEHATRVDPLAWRVDDRPRGMILVADDEKIGGSPGHVRFFDGEGKLLRKLGQLESPADVELLTGERLLVAEHWSGKVTERDSQGRILWEHKTTDKPVSAKRLADGSTFIVTYHEILEVERSGVVRYSFRPEQGMLYCGVRRAGGRILFINGAGDIFETDRSGTVLRQFKAEKYAAGASYWASIEILGPDRYLLALSGSDRIVEIDGTGKIHWEATAKTPTYAQRLPDGTTLVSCVDAKTVVVIDRTGKTLQTIAVGGRPFRARRYRTGVSRRPSVRPL